MKYFNPYASTVVTESRLPHWQQDSAVYFVTFRLGDALPVSLVRELEIERELWLQNNPKPWSATVELEFHKRFTGSIERWLDESHGECLLRHPSYAKVVGDALAYFEGERYHQLAWVVMPNHVHAVFIPRPPWTLEKLVHSWKSFTAHTLNSSADRKGTVWQKDYFDRMIRDREHFGHVARYIRRNPAKANLGVGEYLFWESDMVSAVG